MFAGKLTPGRKAQAQSHQQGQSGGAARGRARSGGRAITGAAASQPQPSANSRATAELALSETSSAPTPSNCATNGGRATALPGQNSPGRTDRPQAPPHRKHANNNNDFKSLKSADSSGV